MVGFAGHMVSVALTELSPCDEKSDIVNMQLNGHGCVPIKLFMVTEILISYSVHMPRISCVLFIFFQSLKNVKTIVNLMGHPKTCGRTEYTLLTLNIP